MKTLKVTSCGECPYIRKTEMVLVCPKANQIIRNHFGILEECPLDDLKPDGIALEEYKVLSKRTVTDDFYCDTQQMRNLLHGAIMMSKEAGELLDHIYKVIFYGTDLDTVNITEELGDLMFGMALILRELDIDFNHILKANIQKLLIRYPEGFSKERAVNRDRKEELTAFGESGERCRCTIKGC
jgi:NTP pyrophosphatase (non-canonical NTP hydrolase)